MRVAVAPDPSKAPENGPKGRNLSGDGDSSRRIDTTAGPLHGIIPARGWTGDAASRYAHRGGLPMGAHVAQGDHRLRTAVAALKAWSGVVALSWATAGFAASAGTASPTLPQVTGPGTTAAKLPSIELLQEQPTLAGTCSGGAFDVNTFINVTGAASAAVTVTAPGVGTIEEFTDETGTNIGPYNAVYPTFQIKPFGGGLPPNTKITITITTYTGPNRTGSVSFVSTIVFNCTTGKVIHAGPVANVAESIPTLSTIALAAMAALLALLGAAMMRRPARRNRA
jgi:hypothetical protein